ncbi:hypothetical protein YPPY48_4265, partial [Yersinia pestis PY-48]
MHCLMNALFDE